MARKQNSDDNQKMTNQEAGQLGGQATSKTHGKQFYENIGSAGGKVSPGNFKNDPERAADAGRKGGQAHGTNAGE